VWVRTYDFGWVSTFSSIKLRYKIRKERWSHYQLHLWIAIQNIKGSFEIMGDVESTPFKYSDYDWVPRDKGILY
jgi:hypothetical protein